MELLINDLEFYLSVEELFEDSLINENILFDEEDNILFDDNTDTW